MPGCEVIVGFVFTNVIISEGSHKDINTCFVSGQMMNVSFSDGPY